MGFTDEALVGEILADCSPHRPVGVALSAKLQPRFLPGVRERWKFIEPILNKAPTNVKVVPMLASLGCPYTCAFCIDSVVDYQPLDRRQITEDLRFLAKTMPSAWVAWHDPNFGVRFDEIMTAIEDAVEPGMLKFGAESSLSLLSEPNLRRLRKAGFKAMLPGIESWYSLGDKSKTGNTFGMAKVNHVSEHVNLIGRYIPYVQTNFVVGLDDDAGREPFELTKRFIDKTPATFPAYSLLSAFGQAAPLNLDMQRDGRVLPFPFHFLNNNQAMNVTPKNYGWADFYDNLIDLTKYSFSRRSIRRRALASKSCFAAWMNVIRAVSSEGYGRIKYYSTVRRLLDSDKQVRDFFEGDTEQIPPFYVDRVQRDLGPLWEFLPAGALHHDPNAYLKKIGGAVRA